MGLSIGIFIEPHNTVVLVDPLGPRETAVR
jgi:hypothetical protein